jgi:uncharacterized spore protein YtfJ
MDVIRETVRSGTTGTVFGEPITRGEVAVVPVARISGRGGGGGGGPAPDDHAGGGSGAGLKISAKPVGVYVLRGADVSWRPSVDLNKIILGGQLVAVVALLTLRAIVTARRRQRPDARR